MSATAANPVPDNIPLAQIEQELTRQLRESQTEFNAPMLRARLSNLVIYCTTREQAATALEAVPQVVAAHPARVLLLIGESGEDKPLKASLDVWSQLGPHLKICSEQVTLEAAGAHVDQLPFALRELIIGDLPTNVWWAAPTPPPLAGHFLFELTEHAQQIIYDSIGWMEPARGVAAVSGWLVKVEESKTHGSWRVASDLNWRRLKFWRRTLAQALDPQTAPGAIESITEVVVDHGPHAVIQAWELVSWLASRLGWKVQQGKVAPNVEIVWQVAAPHGMLRIRIRRLAEGPSQVRKVRIACSLRGAPHALNIATENSMRLAIVLEGTEAAPRTVAVKDASLAELLIQQLSNRERDPVFRESMAVAQVFAQTVLG